MKQVSDDSDEEEDEQARCFISIFIEFQGSCYNNDNKKSTQFVATSVESVTF